MTVALRPYQQEALAAVEQAAAGGIRRQILALPTGTGKTVIFAELIRRRGAPALVLMHRDELITQALSKLAGAGVVGVVKAEQDDVRAPVVVASVQTHARDCAECRVGALCKTGERLAKKITSERKRCGRPPAPGCP